MTDIETTFRNMSKAYRLLEESAPTLLEPLVSTMADSVPDHLTPLQAAQVLFTLPAPVLTTALETSTRFDALIDMAQPYFPDITAIPMVTTKLSAKALFRLKSMDLPYDTHLDPKYAAKLWLERGDLFGKWAWKHHHPRKDPVIGYWEEYGISIPSSGLSPEGLDLMAKTIETFNKSRNLTMKLCSQARSIAWSDWRIVLAFKVAGQNMDSLTTHHGLKNAFENTDPAEFRALFHTPDSAHAALSQKVRLANGPDVRTLLSMDSEAPANVLSTLFPEFVDA